MSSAVPLCRSAADMARLDGQIVRLEGVYRRKMEVLSMPRPGKPPPEPVFQGYVVLELEGSAATYDASRPDDEVVLVQLGQEARPAAEVEQLADRRVVVQGRLVLDAASLLSEEELEMARPDGPPTLVEPGPPSLAP